MVPTNGEINNLGHVDKIRKLTAFTNLKAKLEEYKSKVPEPMNRKFPQRLVKHEAIQNTKKRTRTQLFLLGK